MHYSQCRPSPNLAPWVESYWVLRGRSRTPESVATDGRMEIILHLADPFDELTSAGWRQQPRLLVSGQITQPVTVRPAGEAHTVGVRLKSWAGGAVLCDAASQLTDRLLELEAVNSRLARALRPLLDLSSATHEHIEARLQTCLNSEGNGLDPRIRSAVTCTELAEGRGAVDALRHHTGISNRQLERLFQQHVGVGPKLFARMVRFRSVLKVMSRTPSPNWAHLAADCGYSDQAHLIRDFQQFAGCTPGSLSGEAEPLSLQFASGG